MNLPPLQFAVYALGAAGFFLGLRSKIRWWIFLPLALPALLYAAYYLKVFSEPLWLYRLRAVPGSELLAALAGVPAGAFFRTTPRLARWTVPMLTFGLLFAPYLKFWLDRTLLKETWRDGVCLQSTPSTCGPASAATLCRVLGVTVTERELATESYSTATGTENWYLARALRRRGLTPDWQRTEPNPAALLYPAIAGTQLGGPGGAGHFIVILDKTPEGYRIADPIGGRTTLRHDQLSGGHYYFTGFFLRLVRQ
jgi:hypothetical protein